MQRRKPVLVHPSSLGLKTRAKSVDEEEDFLDHPLTWTDSRPSGKDISQNIAQFSFPMELMFTEKDPQYYVRNRFLTEKEFQHTLDVYTNNQDYYLENAQYDELTGLEHWFLHIIEPRPQSDDYEVVYAWLERELCKEKKHSYSCSEQALQKLQLGKEELVLAWRDLEFTVFIFKLLNRKYGWNKKKKSCKK